MPPKRESLESVKTRLAREQRIRTEQRIRQLLQQSLTRQDREIYDNSEEENRISGRRPRANTDQATQTNSSSLSFSCGVIVGVCVVLLLLSCLVLFSANGDKSLAPRRSPRRKSKTCGRPFKAPRKGKTCKTVAEVETSEAQLLTQDRQDNHDSQIQHISGTENERDIQAREEQEPHVIPFIPCIRLMSERKSDEVARHGEVLRWSSDEDGDNTQKTTLASIRHNRKHPRHL
jgi:hypothetical protein